jgi:hypothetical protein
MPSGTVVAFLLSQTTARRREMFRPVHAAATLGALLTTTLLVLACGDAGTCGEATPEVISPQLEELNKKYDLVPEGDVVQQVDESQGGHRLSSRRVFRLVPKLKANKKGGIGTVTKGLNAGGGIVAKLTVSCETDGCLDSTCNIRGCLPTATGCSSCACAAEDSSCTDGACINCKAKAERSFPEID